MSHAQAQSSLGPFLSSTGSIPRIIEPIPYGTILGKDRYLVRDILGSGGYSTVYGAHDKQCGREMALKIAGMVAHTSSVTRRMIEREYNIYTRIGTHPHIVSVYDLVRAEWEGKPLLVLAMELVTGGTLRDWLNANKDRHDVRVRQGVPLMIQACLGLLAMHKAHVGHRDFKPENCLLTADGRLKLADFGAAVCLHNIAVNISGSQDASLHQWTLTYASPEQLLARHPQHVGLASDIYSLGIVMYELFSPECSPPFTGSLEQICEQHIHRPVNR